jgi:hypothetical protein
MQCEPSQPPPGTAQRELGNWTPSFRFPEGSFSLGAARGWDAAHPRRVAGSAGRRWALGAPGARVRGSPAPPARPAPRVPASLTWGGLQQTQDQGRPPAGPRHLGPSGAVWPRRRSPPPGQVALAAASRRRNRGPPAGIHPGPPRGEGGAARAPVPQPSLAVFRAGVASWGGSVTFSAIRGGNGYE